MRGNDYICFHPRHIFMIWKMGYRWEAFKTWVEFRRFCRIEGLLFSPYVSHREWWDCRPWRKI